MPNRKSGTSDNKEGYILIDPDQKGSPIRDCPFSCALICSVISLLFIDQSLLHWSKNPSRTVWYACPVAGRNFSTMSAVLSFRLDVQTHG